MDFAEIKFTLKTLSVLHVGTGQSDSVVANDIKKEIARIATDKDGNAWIPGSTLKGAFRAACDETMRSRLFGEPHAVGAAFAKGVVSVFGATSATKDLLSLTRTKIHEGTGAAEKNKLFTKKYVKPGAEFEVLVHIADWEGRLDHWISEFSAALSAFRSDRGVSIGSNKADSFGRVQLTGSPTVQRHKFTIKGYVPDAQAELQIPEHRTPSVESISLYCAGPYLVSDPDKSQKNDTQQNDNFIAALRLGDHPLQTGTGLSGVLKARARWLCETRPELATKLEECKTSSGKKKLSTIERLLGAEGFRAKLTLCVDELQHKGEVEIPGVAIDRFTQTPIDKALFFFKANYGVDLKFSLSERCSLSEDEAKLKSALIEDITQNGLKLGFGTTKGFGWFLSQTPAALTPISFPSPVNPPKVKGDDAVTQNVRIVRDDLNEKVPSFKDFDLGQKAKAIFDRFCLINQGQPPKGLTVERVEAALQRTYSEQQNVVYGAPMSGITLPYRTVGFDPKRKAVSEPEVSEARTNRTLHCKPLSNSCSGVLEINWNFEVPMLVGQAMEDKTLKACTIGPEYAIPGASLRGALRSVLEAATGGKLGQFNVEAARASQTLRESYQEYIASDFHNPKEPTQFNPDFVENLFGYIFKTDKTNASAANHDDLHLKSRLSFDCAWNINEGELRRETRDLLLATANAESKLHDHLSWRRYPVTTQESRAILDKMDPAFGQVKDNESRLEFLVPEEDGTLIFKGRIGFHNVTSVELGALLWAITWGGRSEYRHKIGHAKPFEAGRCFASDLAIKFEDTTNTDFSGKIESYMQAFLTFLGPKHCASRNFQELLATARPNAVPGTYRYQTKRMLDDTINDLRSKQGERLTSPVRPT